MEKQIEVYNPNNLPTYHYTELEGFQGDLKTITRDDLNKLKQSLVKHGLFTAKKAFWSDDTLYLLDGHQTVKALKELEDDGYKVPEIPVEIIEVEDRQEAARKLLQINSQYGKLNERTEFFEDMEIDEDEFMDFELDFDTDELDFDTSEFETGEDKQESEETSQEEYEERENPERETEFSVAEGDLYRLGDSYLFCGSTFEISEIIGYCEGEIDFNFDNIDTLFFDPPYQQEYVYQKRMLLKSIPNIKDTLILMGSNKVLSRIYSEFDLNDNEKVHINYRHDLVWDRVNPHLGPNLERPLMYHVPINIYGVNGNNVFNRHNSAVDEIIDKDRIPSIIRIPDQKKYDELLGRGAKPVPLLRVLIASYCSNRVLDCGVGNGTTFIAGEQESRPVFGIEKDTNMCEIALAYFKRETGKQPEKINE